VRVNIYDRIIKACYHRVTIIRAAVHQQDVDRGSLLEKSRILRERRGERSPAILQDRPFRSIVARYRDTSTRACARRPFDLLDGEQIQMTNIHESPQLFCPHGLISGAAEPGDANFRARARAHAPSSRAATRINARSRWLALESARDVARASQA